MALFGHVFTHTPHPIHAAWLTAALSLSDIAPNGHTRAHCPQPAQTAGFACATYPDAISIGVPERCASIAPQQHAQQLQMA